jgi:hypothetical protein
MRSDGFFHRERGCGRLPPRATPRNARELQKPIGTGCGRPACNEYSSRNCRALPAGAGAGDAVVLCATCTHARDRRHLHVHGLFRMPVSIIKRRAVTGSRSRQRPVIRQLTLFQALTVVAGFWWPPVTVCREYSKRWLVVYQVPSAKSLAGRLGAICWGNRR